MAANAALPRPAWLCMVSHAGARACQGKRCFDGLARECGALMGSPTKGGKQTAKMDPSTATTTPTTTTATTTDAYVHVALTVDMRSPRLAEACPATVLHRGAFK